MSYAQVGINTTTPNPSSALHIASTDRGLLIPRLTQAQRLVIPDPAPGLLVYQVDSTEGFWYYDGSNWIHLSPDDGIGEFQSFSGVVRNTTDVLNDSFVFGDTDLEGFGSKFFFDKMNSAFRAGEVSGFEWDSVGYGSVALGLNNLAIGDGSVSIGVGGIATGPQAIVLGNGEATNSGSISIGFDGSATGFESIVLGNGVASGTGSFAGPNGNATGLDATAFHGIADAGALSFYGIAEGASSAVFMGGYTLGINSIAFMSGASALGDYSLAIGLNSVADDEGSIAFGRLAEANAVNAVSLGAFGVADGIDSIVLGAGLASGDQALAIGPSSIASGIESVAIMGGSAEGTNSLAVDGTAEGQNSVAFMGGFTDPFSQYTFAFGPSVLASGFNSAAFGFNSSATGDYSFAFGNNVNAESYGEIVLGYDSASYPGLLDKNFPFATDPLFILANNSSFNAMTVLKNGNVGLSRFPITNTLEVEGDASKTTPGPFVAHSDKRLKTNIQTLSKESALEKLLQMRGVTYEWNDEKTGSKRPEGIQYGFIAQDLMEVFPENVKKDNLGYYQTAYSTYDALYVQSIKALNEKVEQLAEENKMLKAQIKKIHDALKKEGFLDDADSTDSKGK